MYLYNILACVQKRNTGEFLLDSISGIRNISFKNKKLIHLFFLLEVLPTTICNKRIINKFCFRVKLTYMYVHISNITLSAERS